VTNSYAGKGESVEAGAHVRSTVIAEVAAQLNITTVEVESGLYADLAARQRLISFDGPTPERLLDRYNLAQAQALLYRALELRLSIAPQEAANARQIFNAIKSYRLIHTIQGSAQTGYEVTLTGPISMFHRSQKYGIQMAVFLPALLLCKGWHLSAEITPKQREGQKGAVKTRNLFFELDDGQDHLRSHLFAAPDTKGELPSKLLAGWERTKSTWALSHSAEVIDLGANAFVPDLVASHPDGKRIYIEVFGFWTPTHLARRTEEFHREDFTDWLLVASDELRCSREPPSRVHSNVLICKAAIDASLVRMKLEEIKNAA
jgi:predicted nuclease of restriction endonuclease-like RecB superfamily